MLRDNCVVKVVHFVFAFHDPCCVVAIVRHIPMMLNKGAQMPSTAMELERSGDANFFPTFVRLLRLSSKQRSLQEENQDLTLEAIPVMSMHLDRARAACTRSASIVDMFAVIHAVLKVVN